MTALTIETTWKERTLAQFRNSPRILEFIEVLADALQDCADVVEYIDTAFDLDTATGEQLDYLGELLGIYRPRAQETRIFTLVMPGEIPDPDKDFETDETPGGYLGSTFGLEDQDDPDALMSDVDYRSLINQKALSYRKKMTPENLYTYLIQSGARCKIDDDDRLTVTIDPYRYDDLNEWMMNYIVTRGFKPGGVKVQFSGRLRHGDSI